MVVDKGFTLSPFFLSLQPFHVSLPFLVLCLSSFFLFFLFPRKNLNWVFFILSGDSCLFLGFSLHKNLTFFEVLSRSFLIQRKMEGKKQVTSSSSPSSFTSELFGSNQSHPSSTSGIFGSLLSPSSKVFGRESLRSEVSGKTASEGWSSKIGTQDYISKGKDGETPSTASKDHMSSIYQEQRVQPCHLSSSIYYGGQDIYSHPQSTQDSGLNSLYKKDGGEDDSGSASRGNWWQGSLYY